MMKRFFKVTTMLLLVLLVLPAFAMNDGDDYDDDRVDSRKPRKVLRRRKLESWYHMFTLGFVQSFDDDGDKIESDITGSVDFLRFYFPIGKRLIIGAGISGSFLKNDDEDFQSNYYLYSVSVQYYFKSIGDGIFLRADYGASKSIISGSGGTIYGESDWGRGYLVAAGYAYPFSRETSWLFYAAYRNLTINERSVKDVTFNLGWLW